MTTVLDRSRRTVRKPDFVLENGVTRHLPRVDHIVKDDEPALVRLPWLREEGKIRCELIARRKIADRAIHVDIDI